MKLYHVLFAVLALALAEETDQEIADSEAQASMELLKEPRESLEPAASAYNYVPSNTWNNQKNIPQQNRWTNVETSNNYYVPPQNNYVPPQNNYIPPQNNYVPPQNNYVPPQNNNIPPQNNYVPPQNNYVPPQNDYVAPQNDYVAPQNDYVPPKNTYVPQPITIAPPQQGYYPTHTWTTPAYTTTTQNPVIKNEIVYGDNGSYKYEYQLIDGTHVGEHGYYTDPRATEESLVKAGWYSYPGPDGKLYTVKYYADHTGYHAYGDHLPTPAPIPPAIRAALDQQEKEQAEQAENENKPVNTNQQTYYPNQPTNYPSQPANYPSQQTYYPNQPQETYPQQPNYPTKTNSQYN